MGKKAKKREKLAQAAQSPAAGTAVEPISAAGKKVIALGIGVLALGFFVLTLTDRMGRNWASDAAPFLILGGYAIIGLGIFCPDRTRPSPDQKPT
ncbi:MAG TPA: hypothetical protein VNK24_04685 [Elusimicrobiota bacterium]|nr:hypothetical protein [Elusimicrobiota bacterium]